MKARGRLGAAALGLLLTVLLGLTVIVTVCMGKYQVSPGESLSILWCSLWGLPCDSPQMTINVVLSLRIPRILASILVGTTFLPRSVF